MWEWLRTTFTSGQEAHFDFLAARLSLAFALGLVVAGIYWLTQRSAAPRRLELREERATISLFSTLVLLSILIAMVTQVIGDNLARAFGLVGALSIVRFRTVVEDTRDTAFVIFAVVVGMAVGAGHPEVALVGLVIVGVAAAVTRPGTGMAEDAPPFWNLSLRVGLGPGTDGLVAEVFRKHVAESQLLSSSTGRQGAALDLTYRLMLRPTTSPTAMVTDLNRLEGVQSVELRRV